MAVRDILIKNCIDIKEIRMKLKKKIIDYFFNKTLKKNVPNIEKTQPT